MEGFNSAGANRRSPRGPQAGTRGEPLGLGKSKQRVWEKRGPIKGGQDWGGCPSHQSPRGVWEHFHWRRPSFCCRCRLIYDTFLSSLKFKGHAKRESAEVSKCREFFFSAAWSPHPPNKYFKKLCGGGVGVPRAGVHSSGSRGDQKAGGSRLRPTEAAFVRAARGTPFRAQNRLSRYLKFKCGRKSRVSGTWYCCPPGSLAPLEPRPQVQVPP